MNFVRTLLYGLQYVPPRGVPGSIKPVGDVSFCFIGNRDTCIGAAAEYEKGRMIGLSHNAFILDNTKEASASDTIETQRLRRLNRNMVLWAARQGCTYFNPAEDQIDVQCGPLCERPDASFVAHYPIKPQTNCFQPIKISAIGVGSDALAAYTENLMTSTMPGGFVAGISATSSSYDNIRQVLASNPDVIIWTNADITLEIVDDPTALDVRAQLLLQFVEQGGSLIIAFCTWGWESLSQGKGKLDRNSLFNQVGDYAGIHFLYDPAYPESNDGWPVSDCIAQYNQPSQDAVLSSTLESLKANVDVPFDEFQVAMQHYTNTPNVILRPTTRRFNEMLTNNLVRSRDMMKALQVVAENVAPPVFPLIAQPTSNNQLPAQKAKELLYIEWLRMKGETCTVSDLSSFSASIEFPGQVSPHDAKREVDFLVSLNPYLSNWQTTGIYVPPGEQVDVSLSDQTIAAYGDFTYEIDIGSQTDELKLVNQDEPYKLERHRRIHAKRQWNPKVIGPADNEPFSTRSLPATTSSVKTGSLYGGLLYVSITSTDAARAKLNPNTPIIVKVTGGVRAPYVNLQKEKNEVPWNTQTDSYDFTSTWASRLSSCSNAPWGELEGRYLILTVPKASLLKLKDPYSVVEYWDSMAAHELALAGESLTRKERFVPDLQISVGYMHSGYPLMTHLDVYEDTENGIPQFFDLDYLRKNVMWGLYHEFGHNRQKSTWTWGGLTESTVNIFSLYAAEMLNGVKPFNVDFYTQNCRDKAIAYLKDPSQNYQNTWIVDVNVSLTTYIVLIEEFGWNVMADIFAAYYDKSVIARCVDDQSKINEWVRQSSLAARTDLRPLYDQWRIPYENSRLSDLDGLPKWTKDSLTILLEN